MFKIMTKYMSLDELRILAELWENMIAKFTEKYSKDCKSDCKGCKYRRLCTSLDNALQYLYKAIREREREGK